MHVCAVVRVSPNRIPTGGRERRTDRTVKRRVDFTARQWWNLKRSGKYIAALDVHLSEQFSRLSA